MKAVLKSVLFLALLASGAAEAGSVDKKRYPVSKVIALLKDMKAQLEKEAEEDEEIYDKMACWCQTNDKDKSKAIIDAEARISDLSSTVEQLTAQSARLKAEIKGAKEE